MEFIDGNDLAKHVSENGPLPVDQTVHVISQTAQALSYAHGEGVVHRDVKPHNLLLSEQTDSGLGVSSVKVLDMGLARFDSFMTDNPDASVHAAMTTTGVIMGTVDYMAPEQAICTRDADNRSDIYSLGCTMHFLLTGEPVYDGETIMARLVAHRETPIPSLQVARGDVSPNLDAVFRKMVAKRAEHRYQSMEELLRDLDAITSGQQPRAALVDGVPSNASETLNVLSTETLPAAPVFPAARQPELRQTSVVEQSGSRARKSKRALWIWITGLGMTSLTTICLLMFASLWFGQEQEQVAGAKAEPAQAKPKIIGHPGTLRNGGKGRALFLLPTNKKNHFHDEQFIAIRKDLEGRGVECVSMGMNDLPANPKHGRMAAFNPDLTLDKFNKDDFDAIFIVEGSLQHERPEGLNQILTDAVDDGQVVSVVREAASLLKEAGLVNDKAFGNDGGFAIAKPENGQGAFVQIQNDCDIGKATELIFTELLKDRQRILDELSDLK